jgi:predicted DNA-binding transcriptional regulator AlpA
MQNLIRMEALLKKLSISRATVWRWVKGGHLPAPIRIGPNVVAWPEGQIDEWIATRSNRA